MIGIVFLIVGTSLIIWSKPISEAVHMIHATQFRKLLGDGVNWDNQSIKKFYRFMFFMGGILALLGAYGAFSAGV
jgi:Na+/H+ antiporter NhaC